MLQQLQTQSATIAPKGPKAPNAPLEALDALPPHLVSGLISSQGAQFLAWGGGCDTPKDLPLDPRWLVNHVNHVEA